MGYVVILSLPMVVFFILLSFGCYALGRHKGQQEGRSMVAAQERGIINPAQSQSTMVAAAEDGVMAPPVAGGTLPPPAPAPPHQYPGFPSPSPHHPNPIYLKQQNDINAV